MLSLRAAADPERGTDPRDPPRTDLPYLAEDFYGVGWFPRPADDARIVALGVHEGGIEARVAVEGWADPSTPFSTSLRYEQRRSGGPGA